MQLEKRAITLAVRVGGTHHDDDQVEEKRGPTDHKSPHQDGECQGASHAAAPPLPPPTTTRGQRCNLARMYASQHKNEDVEEADDGQGEEEEDDEVDHDEGGVKEPHHENS